MSNNVTIIQSSCDTSVNDKTDLETLFSRNYFSKEYNAEIMKLLLILALRMSLTAKGALSFVVPIFYKPMGHYYANPTSMLSSKTKSSSKIFFRHNTVDDLFLKVSHTHGVSHVDQKLHSMRNSDVDENLVNNWDVGGTFEDYSNSLSMTSVQQQNNVEEELAVYTDSRHNKRPLKNLVRFVQKNASKYLFRSTKAKKKGTLIFVRGVR